MGEIIDESVEALVDEVGDLLDDEDRRSQSFIARGTGLAAFVGLIVPLVGLFNRTSNDGLGSTAKLSVAVLFLAGVGLLLTAVGFVLFGVLKPSPGKTISMAEVEKFPTYAYVTTPRIMNQGRRLRGLVNSLTVERTRNERKGRWLYAAYFVLASGLVCISADGLILGLDQIL